MKYLSAEDFGEKTKIQYFGIINSYDEFIYEKIWGDICQYLLNDHYKKLSNIFPNVNNMLRWLP